MKKTIDNKEILDRIWYYLLDFNDSDNWETIKRLTNQTKLSMITHDELLKLYKEAIKNDEMNLLKVV